MIPVVGRGLQGNALQLTAATAAEFRDLGCGVQLSPLRAYAPTHFGNVVLESGDWVVVIDDQFNLPLTAMQFSKLFVVSTENQLQGLEVTMLTDSEDTEPKPDMVIEVSAETMPQAWDALCAISPKLDWEIRTEYASSHFPTFTVRNRSNDHLIATFEPGQILRYYRDEQRLEVDSP